MQPIWAFRKRGAQVKPRTCATLTEVSPNAHQPYQAADAALFQYGYWEYDGFCFRGPPLAASDEGRRVEFIGAAQTFGRFARAPYPTLLGETLQRPILNLGYAGAGPAFFTTKPGVLALAESSAAVVVQVLSGWSVSNSLFEADNLGSYRQRSEAWTYDFDRINKSLDQVLAQEEEIQSLIRQSGRPVHRVEYDALVAAPEAEVAALCRFMAEHLARLGRPADPGWDEGAGQEKPRASARRTRKWRTLPAPRGARPVSTATDAPSGWRGLDHVAGPTGTASPFGGIGALRQTPPCGT